jgi:hypothetical protein
MREATQGMWVTNQLVGGQAQRFRKLAVPSAFGRRPERFLGRALDRRRRRRRRIGRGDLCRRPFRPNWLRVDRILSHEERSQKKTPSSRKDPYGCRRCPGQGRAVILGYRLVPLFTPTPPLYPGRGRWFPRRGLFKRLRLCTVGSAGWLFLLLLDRRVGHRLCVFLISRGGCGP